MAAGAAVDLYGYAVYRPKNVGNAAAFSYLCTLVSQPKRQAFNP